MSGVAAAADDEHRRRESWSELIFRCTVSAILGFSTHLALLSILHFFGALSLFLQIIFSVGVLLIAITVGQFVRRFFGVQASAPAFLGFHMIFMWIAFITIVAQAQESVSPLQYILFNGMFALVLNGFFRMLFRDPGFVSVAEDSTKEELVTITIYCDLIAIRGWIFSWDAVSIVRKLMKVFWVGGMITSS